MEKVDQAMEQRVWKRVRGEELPPVLQELAAAELGSAGMFLMLSRQLQGSDKELLRRLYFEEKRHCAILQGMYTAITGQPLPLRTPQPEPGTPQNSLRKCYAGALQAFTAYGQRCADNQYAPVFGELAKQEQAHCAAILELLGRLHKGPLV